MTNIALVGINGKMGQVICRILEDSENSRIVCGVDINTEQKNGVPVYTSLCEAKENPDVIIDFSHPSSLEATLSYAVANKKALVLATTGLSAEQMESVRNASKETAVFFSANMSLGVNTVFRLAALGAQVLANAGYDIEIVEKHHNLKLDAPSGTALAIADAMNAELNHEYIYKLDRSQERARRGKKEIGIQAVRGGNIVGEHEVFFCGPDEVIEIKHTAYSKGIFGKGALAAAAFLKDKEPGMYAMRDVIA